MTEEQKSWPHISPLPLRHVRRKQSLQKTSAQVAFYSFLKFTDIGHYRGLVLTSLLYSPLYSLKSEFLRAMSQVIPSIQNHQIIKNRFPGPYPKPTGSNSQEGSQKSLHFFKKQAYSPSSLTTTTLYVIPHYLPILLEGEYKIRVNNLSFRWVRF